MPLPSVPPVPESPEELQTWAERHQVGRWLDLSLRQFPRGLDWSLREGLSDLPSQPSVREALTEEATEHALREVLPGSLFDAFRGELRSQLHAAAIEQAQAQRAEELNLARWKRYRAGAAVPRPIRALADALLRTRRQLRAHLPAAPPRGSSPPFIRFPTDPLRIEYQGPLTAAAWEQPDVTIELTSWPAPPTLTCDAHPGASSCLDQVAALDAALEHLLNPRMADHLNPAWIEELRKPAWRRFFESTEPPPELDGRELSASRRIRAAPAGMLSWRVELHHGQVSLKPLSHKQLKSGAWSQGYPVSAQNALTHPDWHTTPADQRALELRGAIESLPDSAPMYRQLLYRALEALVGHPQLSLADQGGSLTPLRLEPGHFELSVERAPDGYFIPKLTFAGSTDRAQAALDLVEYSGTWKLLIERPAGDSSPRGYLVEAPGRNLELLRNLALYHPRIPPSAAPGLLARLAPVENQLPLQLPPELEGEPVPPDLRPTLRLRLHDPQDRGAEGTRQALELEVMTRPLPGGPPQVPGQGAQELARFEGARRVRVQRDFPGEEAAAEALLARLPLTGAEAPSRWQRRLASLDDALDLVASLQALPTEGSEAIPVEWLHHPPVLTRQAKAADLRVEITDRHDWFGLSGELEIDGERVKLALLLEALRHQARYVQVGPHRWVALSRELCERLGEAADVVRGGGRQGLEVSPLAATALSDLLESAGHLKVSARWRSLVRRLDAAQARSHELPEGLEATLRPYQVEGYHWLLRLADCGMGAVLADDMGLGKTLQALAVLLARGSLGPALVVAPTSVCFNWEREAERFAPSLELTRYGGPSDDRGALLMELGKGEVVVTSYGLLVEDAERFQEVPWATVVLDEAQALKNAATLRARTVRDLEATWTIALTGTPLENHVGELWSLFRAVAPGLLGSWEHFRERFAVPIERDRSPARRDALARVVRPFVLRRTKSEVAPELPSRTEIQLPVTLSKGERRLYDNARMAALAQLTGAVHLAGGKAPRGGAVAGPEDRRFEVLAALTRLRQLACHPRLYDPDSRERSSKLEKLLEVIDELRAEGHRALVFSQFTSHLALVREALDARQVPYRYLDGATRPKDRQAAVDAFQGGEGDLFLISLKAGGTGLNLTGADYVIHLDPWWNPAVEDQATDRAHRIGQTKPVTVYRLVSQGTIEEAILALHADKRDLVASLLAGTDRAGKLSTEQLIDLIRSGAADADEETSDGDAPSPRPSLRLVRGEDSGAPAGVA